MDNKFVFFPSLDFIGHDSNINGVGKSLDKLFEIANSTDEIVAFNTYGYLKDSIGILKSIRGMGSNNKKYGIYVKSKYINELHTSEPIGIKDNKVVEAFEYTFRVFGIRRSGNHFIIGSIIQTLPQKSVYWFNDLPNSDYKHFVGSIYQADTKEKRVAGNPVMFTKLLDGSPDKIHTSNTFFIETYEDKNLSQIFPTISQRSSKHTINILT